MDLNFGYRNTSLMLWPIGLISGTYVPSCLCSRVNLSVPTPVVSNYPTRPKRVIPFPFCRPIVMSNSTIELWCWFSFGSSITVFFLSIWVMQAIIIKILMSHILTCLPVFLCQSLTIWLKSHLTNLNGINAARNTCSAWQSAGALQTPMIGIEKCAGVDHRLLKR